MVWHAELRSYLALPHRSRCYVKKKCLRVKNSHALRSRLRARNAGSTVWNHCLSSRLAALAVKAPDPAKNVVKNAVQA
jgi:hypothetical protein